jgi:Kef-type K+ transport system membrane component KefB/nucleotide-binding universal stress UspA family protein
MRPLSEHAIFVFLLQFTVLLAAARGLGAVAQKLKQPSVVGELLAGIILGPAILGHLWPAAHGALFPKDPTQEHLLEMLSWLGMILLILRTGLEVDLRLWRFLGRAALLTSALGMAIPYLTGFGLGKWLPQGLIAPGHDRTVLALFLATAMSISAVKVIAKTLLDLKLMRRDIGAIILAASMTDDTVAWALLSVVSSIAISGKVSVPTVVKPVAATALVILVAAIVLRPLVRRTIGWIERNRRLEHATISAIAVLCFGMAAATQKLGIHAVFGAFVAGVILTESPRIRQVTLDALDSVIIGVFAPVFFVYTGLRVTSLTLPPWQITLLILGIAILGKVVGAGLGAKLGGLPFMSALAVGIGMSSRGSTELVVARIGMDLGVLTPSLYAAIVLIPIVTSIATPALLKVAVGSAKPAHDEAKRLDEEKEKERAIIKREGTKILVALSGGPRSFQAMRLAAPLARLPGATMVAMAVVPRESDEGLPQRRDVLTGDKTRATIDQFAAEHPLPDFHGRVVAAPSPVAAIEEELQKGYDLVFVGAGRRRTISNRILSATVESGIANAVVVSGETFPREFRRILVAADGGFAARGAAELAVLYAKAVGAEVQVLNVVDTTSADAAGQERLRDVGSRVVNELAQFGSRHGVRVDGRVARSGSAARTIADAARELDANLVVLGAVPQMLGRRTFLGNTVEYLLTYAPCPVALFVPALPRAGAKAA